MEDDPLILWRLAPEVTVIEAALLVAGHNPSDYTTLRASSRHADGVFSIFQRDQPAGFDAAFTALKAAIRKKLLQANLSYAESTSFTLTSGEIIVSGLDVARLLASSEHSRSPEPSTLRLYAEPDWGRSTLVVEELKVWLRSRGVSTGFFFADYSGETGEDFLDSGHDHFSPELALAVLAWRALAEENKFRGSIKSAIEAWMRANPDAWQGEGKLSSKAKDRVATVVNWKPIGGAPKTADGT